MQLNNNAVTQVQVVEMSSEQAQGHAKNCCFAMNRLSFVKLSLVLHEIGVNRCVARSSFKGT